MRLRMCVCGTLASKSKVETLLAGYPLAEGLF
jgi:hypothetical protein